MPNKPDTIYEREVQAAVSAGLKYELVNFEALVDKHDVVAAVKRIKTNATREVGIYRGWMLTPQQYTQLYNALGERGLVMINTPDQYKHCHYLPESYGVIKTHTPRTVFLRYDENFTIDRVMEILTEFGDKAVILKDYVKSRKHEWNEACYIPSASDRKVVEKVLNRFLDLQGHEVNEGFVFREFIEFQPLATHSKSGMPLTKEFRLFFIEGKLLHTLEYWEEGNYGEIKPPSNLFDDVAKRVSSHFFTMDVAQRINGEWMIVELGDAQVAGLPENADITKFYESLREAAVNVCDE